ncbi:MAG: response regulator [Chloroflexi bacterium]|nr:response regulator [Chloroflexota bacterium]
MAIERTTYNLDGGIDLELALQELRHNTLSLVAPALLILGWFWLFVNFMSQGIMTSRDLPAFFLVASMMLVLIVRGRHRELACWLLLPALVGTQALTMWQTPSPLLLVFGIAGMIILSAALGAWQAILGSALLWGAGTAVLLRLEPTLISQALLVLLLYLICTGAVWLGGRSLRVAVSWALNGWQRAQEALEETRARRGELYRALHALEEATYRIERMNNELIVARAEAEEARALKARFVATVSHEIRGPLNLILGFSRLMALSPERYRSPLPPDYRADVVTIYRNSQHLSSLVDDILDLSQIEANHLPLIKERVDLEPQVIQEAVEIVRPLASRKGLSLTLNLHGNLPTLLIDPVRVRQVLLNLLTNAVRFSEKGGITLSTKLEEDRVIVSVQDTGPGIPQEELPQLFKAFHQLSTTVREGEKGSGLGLSISKQLVELHGGEIWVESQVDVGTTVSFSLPLPGQAGGALGVTTPKERRSAQPRKEYVLVAHPDLAMVRILSRYLEDYRVIGLPAEEVRTVVEELHPRAILTTPELAGPIRESLASLPYDVPLITCAMPRLTEALADGILGYLVKPVTPEMLTTVMKRVYHNGEMTVLLVDDDPDALRLIETMLLAIPRPYRILKAYDGLQALHMMAEVKPDLVFADLLMPGMDGEEMIARMRADERLAQVPVVILSARDWSEEALTIGLPLSVHRRQPLKIGQAAACLLALLKQIAPRYLAEPEPVAKPAAAPLH